MILLHIPHVTLRDLVDSVRWALPAPGQSEHAHLAGIWLWSPAPGLLSVQACDLYRGSYVTEPVPLVSQGLSVMLPALATTAILAGTIGMSELCMDHTGCMALFVPGAELCTWEPAPNVTRPALEYAVPNPADYWVEFGADELARMCLGFSQAGAPGIVASISGGMASWSVDTAPDDSVAFAQLPCTTGGPHRKFPWRLSVNTDFLYMAVSTQQAARVRLVFETPVPEDNQILSPLQITSGDGRVTLLMPRKRLDLP